jgi:arginase
VAGIIFAMTVVSVPFFIGSPTPPLDAPPGETLSPALPDGSPQARMGVLYRALAGSVTRIATGGDVPLVYAGDCLAAIGVLAGLQGAGLDPDLVWFDAHGDFHTWETTRSSFLGGMPLAMIVGRGEQTIVAAAGLTPLPEDRVALVDARDLDPGEDAAVAGSGMTVLPVAAIPGWTPPQGPLHVHVDLDVVDPAEMPAHRYPAPGGPSLREVGEALDHLAATGLVAAVSFSAWDPGLPGADRAAAAARQLAAPWLAARSHQRPTR